MKNVFKKLLQQKEYSFYRTIDGSDAAYFIMFDQQGKRASVKIERDAFGSWRLARETSEGLSGLVAQECLLAIMENERAGMEQRLRTA